MKYRSVFREGLLTDQVVVVSGGGSGIGRCIAHEVAALGAHAVLIGRRTENLEKVANEIIEDGGKADFLACDIREEARVREAVAGIVARHGRIDGLVNNAGGQFPAPLEKISANGWQAVLNTNLMGGFLFARECYVQSMKGRGGAIVNIIADMWGGMPGMGHSGAARAGMLNFTETAASEWAPVRVNAVAPGWIASSGLDTYPPAMQQMIRSLGEHVPLARVGREAEVSSAVVFLLSEGAAFVSGTCVRVDGAAPNARRHMPLPARKPGAIYDGFHRAVTPKVLQD
ncbi:MAG: SDR family oxidoreductase [Xanthobacteraceae bacterium]|jgi:citronellol/citronellal dehydrogenase